MDEILINEDEEIYSKEFLDKLYDLVKIELVIPLTKAAKILLGSEKRANIISDVYMNTFLLYKLDILRGPSGGLTILGNKTRRNVDYVRSEMPDKFILEDEFLKSLNTCIDWWKKQIPRSGISVSFFADRVGKEYKKEDRSAMIIQAINNGQCGKMYTSRNTIFLGSKS